MEFKIKYDFERICRVCLMESDRLVNIFHPEFGGRVIHTISTCCGIKITENDILPKQICTDCTTLASIAYSFKQKCESADAKLREYLISESEAFKQQEDLNIDDIGDYFQYDSTQVESIFPSPRPNLMDTDSRQPVRTSTPVTPFECHLCQSLFKCCKDLVDHVISDHTQTVIQTSVVLCEMCNSSFSSKFHCDRHKAVEHRKLFVDSGTISCPFCDELFSTYENQLKHMETHVELSYHCCEKCQCYFRINEFLVNHNKISHSSRDDKNVTIDTDIIKNGICLMDDSYSFLNNELDLGPDDLIPSIDVTNLNNSFMNQPVDNSQCITDYDANKVLSEVLQCAEPLRSFSRCDDKENNHIKDIKDDEACPETFAKPKDLKPKRKIKYDLSCSYCSKKFCRLGTLKIHESKHRQEKNYLCVHCGQKYFTQPELKRHIFRIHKDIDSDKKYVCSVCSKEYNQRHRLIAHIKTHEPKKKVFVCSTCGKVLSTSSNFHVHMRRHTGEMFNICHICDRAYPSASDLKAHMLIHTNVKPWECEICHKTFRLKRVLIAHTRTHTGERPYICKKCNMGFKQISDLNYHTRKEVCDKRSHYQTNPDNSVLSKRNTKQKKVAKKVIKQNYPDIQTTLTNVPVLSNSTSVEKLPIENSSASCATTKKTSNRSLLKSNNLPIVVLNDVNNTKSEPNKSLLLNGCGIPNGSKNITQIKVNSNKSLLKINNVREHCESTLKENGKPSNLMGQSGPNLNPKVIVIRINNLKDLLNK